MTQRRNLPSSAERIGHHVLRHSDASNGGELRSADFHCGCGHASYELFTAQYPKLHYVQLSFKLSELCDPFL
jgi:hypothetical protein